MPAHGKGGGGGGGGGGVRSGSQGLPRGTNLIQRAIMAALRQRGTPYVWGGSAPGGFDCSGLVYWAYRHAGYEGIGRTTYDQIKQGHPVYSAAQLRPGDIVFPEAGHEGLYIGHGMILEAPHTGDQVKTIPLSSFGFWQARRLLAGGGGIIPPRVGVGGVSQSGLPVPHPSINPGMFRAWMAHQTQLMQSQSRAFQKQMADMARQQQQDLQKQFATQRQQSLAANIQQQAQQRIQGGQAAQQGLTAGGGLGGLISTDAAGLLSAQRKAALEDTHAKALRNVGVGV
jgi:NlpC/P60 family